MLGRSLSSAARQAPRGSLVRACGRLRRVAAPRRLTTRVQANQGAGGGCRLLVRVLVVTDIAWRSIVATTATAPKQRPAAGTAGGLGDDDIDVAVFRFTLGIPGFDDRNIPRVVGLVMAAALAINHLASPEPVPDAQARPRLTASCVVCRGVHHPLMGWSLRWCHPAHPNTSWQCCWLMGARCNGCPTPPPPPANPCPPHLVCRCAPSSWTQCWWCSACWCQTSRSACERCAAHGGRTRPVPQLAPTIRTHKTAGSWTAAAAAAGRNALRCRAHGTHPACCHGLPADPAGQREAAGLGAGGGVGAGAVPVQRPG